MPPLSGISSALITGANRGIGLALVRELLERTSRTRTLVFATCRNPVAATVRENHWATVMTLIQALIDLAARYSNLRLVQLDVLNDHHLISAIDEVKTEMGDDQRGLGLLINNAGILEEVPRIDPDNEVLFEVGVQLPGANRHTYLRHFDVNVMGAVMVSQVPSTLLRLSVTLQIFLPMLKQHAAVTSSPSSIINISSFLGSIAGSEGSKRTPFGNIPYCLTKSALNHLTKSLAVDLAGSGVITAAICPGWVRTAMGGENAEISPESSAKAVLDTVESLTEGKSGEFMNRFGKRYDY